MPEGLLAGGADPHVPTPGCRDHQDRGGIEALLAEMPRDGRGPLRMRVEETVPDPWHGSPERDGRFLSEICAAC
jgi:hypothetical protein